MQFAGMLCVVHNVAFILGYFVSSCRMIMALISDIECELLDLDSKKIEKNPKNGIAPKKQPERIRWKLYEIIQFHSLTEQLS